MVKKAIDIIELCNLRTGLDTNDPAPKYQLKSMYVAFKSFAPEMDIGFDLSKEYAAAKSVHSGKAVQ